MIKSKNSFTVVNFGAKHALTALAHAHGADFDKLEINDFLNLVELYKLADSKDENSFNCIINAFGQNFHDYRENQLVSFVKNLAHVGLNQEDIFSAVVERTEQLFDENLAKPEDEQ